MFKNPQNFPIFALGNDLAKVVIEVHKETGAPISSIASAVLSSVSLACQGRLRVKKRANLISPVSLWHIVIQGSGERKSAVVKRIFEPVQTFQQEQEIAHEVKLKRYRAELSAWNAEKKGIHAAIKQNAQSGQPSDDEKEQLVELERSKPTPPKGFKLLHENATPEAIKLNLFENFPTASLLTDEAAALIASQVLRDLGALNKLSDGSPLPVDRVSSGSFVVRDASLTVMLFVQREVLNSYLQGKGELARDVGFLARFFVTCPMDAAGTRFLAHSTPANPEVMNRFGARIHEILHGHIADDGESLAKPIELSFDAQAQLRWEQEHDAIESMLAPGGYLYSIKDFGAKLADKMARLAALLHYFGGSKDPIGVDTLERAIQLCRWFAEEFVRVFVPPPAPPPEVADGNLLLPWLANSIRIDGAWSIRKTELLQQGPNQLRNKLRLNAALIYLSNYNALQFQKIKKTTWVVCNPGFFTHERIHQLCMQGAKF